MYEKNDPRETAYLSLYIAVKWFQEITPEQARNIIRGSSHAKPGTKLTSAKFKRIKQVISSPNFVNMNSVSRKFRVNKYEVYQMLAKERGENKNTEEVLVMAQVENLLKRLKNTAENCAGDCEKCTLDGTIYENITLCELLCDIEFDEDNRLKGKKRELQKNAINCKLEGDTKTRGFEVYQNVLDRLEDYMQQHKDKKVRDIVSAALLEYVSKKNKPG